VRLEPGDAMVLCTDGVVEANSAAGEQFGWERLQQTLAAGSSRASELAARLERDLRAHVGEAAQNDDLTLVVFGAIEVIAAKRRRRMDETTEVSVAKD
jgi:serine phosphatase RsbU (regulator of sigma subunit)